MYRYLDIVLPFDSPEMADLLVVKQDIYLSTFGNSNNMIIFKTVLLHTTGIKNISIVHVTNFAKIHNPNQFIYRSLNYPQNIIFLNRAFY